MSNNEIELHLFIIWNQGRAKEAEIIADLEKHFSIIEIREITWLETKIQENFCRFYSAHFAKKDIGIRGRGAGTFILITFIDKTPHYELKLTSSGHAYVNNNLLVLKNKYREWIGNDFAIHCTVTPEETRHDLLLLLGITYDQYLNGQLCTLLHSGLKSYVDLLGSPKWNTVNEIFTVLNECITYTLLRDFEANTDSLGQASDIDLLIDDASLEIVPFLLNAPLVLDEVPGTYVCQVTVQNHLIPFHFHTHTYLSRKWVHDILKTRIKNEANLYVPELKQQFYSLVYQLMYWKPIIKPKYFTILKNLSSQLSLKFNNQYNEFDQYYHYLNYFIKLNNYFPELPCYVRVNPEELLETIKGNLECYKIQNLKPYRVNLWKPGQGVKLFTGVLNDGQKVIIKYYGTVNIVKKEFQILEYLKKYSNLNIPQPYFYRILRGGHQLLVTEFIEGESLADKNLPHLQDSLKKHIIRSFVEAITFYNSKGFIHRDIDPSNILISYDQKVFIIDFEYMIDKDKRILTQDYDSIYSLATLYNLGVPNNYGKLKWNDAYAAIKIINSLEPNFRDKYPDFYYQLYQLSIDKKATYSLPRTTISYIKKFIKYKLSRLLSLFSLKGRGLIARLKN